MPSNSPPQPPLTGKHFKVLPFRTSQSWQLLSLSNFINFSGSFITLSVLKKSYVGVIHAATHSYSLPVECGIKSLSLSKISRVVRTGKGRKELWSTLKLICNLMLWGWEADLQPVVLGMGSQCNSIRRWHESSGMHWQWVEQHSSAVSVVCKGEDSEYQPKKKWVARVRQNRATDVTGFCGLKKMRFTSDLFQVEGCSRAITTVLFRIF